MSPAPPLQRWWKSRDKGWRYGHLWLLSCCCERRRGAAGSAHAAGGAGRPIGPPLCSPASALAHRASTPLGRVGAYCAPRNSRLAASLLEHEALPPAPGVGHVRRSPLLRVNLELGHLGEKREEGFAGQSLECVHGQQLSGCCSSRAATVCWSAARDNGLAVHCQRWRWPPPRPPYSTR